MPWPPQPNEYLDLVEAVESLGVASSEPSDGSLSAGDVRFWFDDDNVAPELHIKAKTADGSLATATIPLTPA
jgi:hypothetical protein